MQGRGAAAARQGRRKVNGTTGIRVVLALIAGIISLNAMADADADYRAGSDFARQVRGQGESSLKNFNPSANIPDYTASPAEKKYYGGVTATGDGALKADGTQAWTTNEATQAVTDSFINNPKEPISPDAPFIQASQDIQSRADSITGKTGQTQCEAQNISRSEFTNHTCERDLLVEQYCTRTASITGDFRTDVTTKVYTLPLTQARASGSTVLVDYTLPATGTIQSATLQAYYTAKPDYSIWENTFSLLGKSLRTRTSPAVHDLGVTGYGAVQGRAEVMSIAIHSTGQASVFAKSMATSIQNGGITVTLTLVIQESIRVWVPRVEWTESYPFSKNEGTLTRTECTEAGSTKTVVVEGMPYAVTEACWSYRDTYMTQAADAGACKTYADNPACTLATRQCAFYAEDGSGCLHEYATWSCETRTSGQVMICGGDTFCLDGECERAQQGKNGDFAPVVSALAALAAAGKDVAELNGENVRAFTGSAKFCKKFAAGFSNCCRDSGWGQDVGLSSCSTEEKALGKAKEKKLTVSVGEFCSKKVLGICLEKKRGYCQFDSKLAQIVQQQGRNGQLHVGFGSASSPNCRGITVDELQRINFDQLDFSNFFEDLQNNKNIPDNAILTERVREQIASQLQNNN